MDNEPSTPMSIKSQTEPRFFYGWVIVAVCFFLQGLSAGTALSIVGVFAVVFAKEFSSPHGTVLFMTSSVMMLSAAVFVPIAGILMRRYSLKLFVVFGLFWMGTGFILLSFTQQIYQVAVIYSLLLAVGYVLLSLGTNTLIANWFIMRRGRALGFTAAGMSTFAFICSPLATHWIALFGWRNTCLLIALIFFSTIVVATWLIIDRPELRGLHPDGNIKDYTMHSQNKETTYQWTFKSIVTAPRFWLMTLAFSLILGVSGSIMTNLVPIAISSGSSPAYAAWLVSMTAICGLLGKIVFGIAADFIHQRMMIWIPCLMTGVACLFLMGNPAYEILIVASIFLGIATGATAPAQGTIAGINFGRGAFSLAMGLMGPFVAIALAVAVPLVGWIHDVSGSYDFAWLVFLGLLIPAAIAGYLLPTKEGRS